MSRQLISGGSNLDDKHYNPSVAVDTHIQSSPLYTVSVGSNDTVDRAGDSARDREEYIYLPPRQVVGIVPISLSTQKNKVLGPGCGW